ncbi:Uncharacterized protein PBTT_00374 [Plasmodiophora brassicae]
MQQQQLMIVCGIVLLAAAATTSTATHATGKATGKAKALIYTDSGWTYKPANATSNATQIEGSIQARDGAKLVGFNQTAMRLRPALDTTAPPCNSTIRQRGARAPSKTLIRQRQAAPAPAVPMADEIPVVTGTGEVLLLSGSVVPVSALDGTVILASRDALHVPSSQDELTAAATSSAQGVTAAMDAAAAAIEKQNAAAQAGFALGAVNDATPTRKSMTAAAGQQAPTPAAAAMKRTPMRPYQRQRPVGNGNVATTVPGPSNSETDANMPAPVYANRVVVGTASTQRQANANAAVQGRPRKGMFGEQTAMEQQRQAEDQQTDDILLAMLLGEVPLPGADQAQAHQAGRKPQHGKKKKGHKARRSHRNKNKSGSGQAGASGVMLSATGEGASVNNTTGADDDRAKPMNANTAETGHATSAPSQNGYATSASPTNNNGYATTAPASGSRAYSN